MTAASPLPVRVPLVTEPKSILESLQMARRNVLSIIPAIAMTQPMVSGKTGKRWHMVMDPDAIRHMLLEKVDDYPKSKATKNLLKPAIGNSLFIAEGAEWRWQRRAAAPVFAHRNVQALAPIMSAAAEDCCARLEIQPEAAVNMLDEMVRTTFDVIADVTFSGEGSFDAAAVHRAIDAYIAEAGKISILDMLGAPDWLPRPGRFLSGSAVKEMRMVADRAITDRQQRGARDVPDLLDLLLAGEDPETARRMNTAELRDNLLAPEPRTEPDGHPAGHRSGDENPFDPEVQDRARREIAEVCQGRTATGEDVENLPYVRMIIEEALRLYPPAGIISRTAMSDDTLCGREVRKGDTVMIPIYALHRSERLWQAPDAFRPERFSDRKAIDRYAYLPFGDGPRICIGASFAMQEAVIILATLLGRFSFTPVTGRDPAPVMILTTRPEGGVWLQAEAI